MSYNDPMDAGSIKPEETARAELARSLDCTSDIREATAAPTFKYTPEEMAALAQAHALQSIAASLIEITRRGLDIYPHTGA